MLFVTVKDTNMYVMHDRNVAISTRRGMQGYDGVCLHYYAKRAER